MAPPGKKKTKPIAQSHGVKYAARHSEIVDMAARLFAEKGYSSTSVNDLCEAAGIGKGGLYYYIGAKEDLLIEIHDRVMEPLLERSLKIASGPGSAAARLRMVSEVLLVIIFERIEHVWVFLHEYRALTGERLRRFREGRQVFERVISDLLAAGVAEGQFQVEDLRMTTLAFLNMHNYTYQWVHPGGRLDPIELSAFYCRLLFRGLGTTTLDCSGVEEEVVYLRTTLPVTGGGASGVTPESAPGAHPRRRSTPR